MYSFLRTWLHHARVSHMHIGVLVLGGSIPFYCTSHSWFHGWWHLKDDSDIYLHLYHMLYSAYIVHILDLDSFCGNVNVVSYSKLINHCFVVLCLLLWSYSSYTFHGIAEINCLHFSLMNLFFSIISSVFLCHSHEEGENFAFCSRSVSRLVVIWPTVVHMLRECWLYLCHLLLDMGWGQKVEDGYY